MRSIPSVEGSVKWFAKWVASSAPSIQYEDAVQDLWVEVMLAAPKYDDATSNAFSTFINRHLRWRAMNMMREEAVRLKYDAAYAAERIDTYHHDEQSVEGLANAILKRLSAFDQKVFNHLVNPPPGVLSESAFDPEPDRVVNWRLASYMRVPKRKIDYAKKKIRKVMRELDR